MFVDVIIRCQIYFVFLIFVVRANHKNILTTEISRSMVVLYLHIHVQKGTRGPPSFLKQTRTLVHNAHTDLQIYFTAFCMIRSIKLEYLLIPCTNVHAQTYFITGIYMYTMHT